MSSESSNFPPTTSRRSLLKWGLALVPGFAAGCSLTKPEPSLIPEPTSTVPGQVVLQWKGEPGLKGFNVYRRKENGPSKKVNTAIVKPVQAYTGGRTLDNYEYIDRDVFVGETYSYQYEEVRADGTTTLWQTPVQKVGNAITTPAERS